MKSIYLYFKSLENPGNGGFIIIIIFSLHRMKWLGGFPIRQHTDALQQMYIINTIGQ